MARKTIVILGGYGVFGSHIADQLAKDGAARVVVAGRDVNKGRACAETIGAEFARCDARDRDSLRGVLSGADLVVNAAGPFQDSEYLAAEACIDQRCHYIDIGDGWMGFLVSQLSMRCSGKRRKKQVMQVRIDPALFRARADRRLRRNQR